MVVGADVSYNYSNNAHAWLNVPSGVGSLPGSRVLSGLGDMNYPPGSVPVHGQLSNLGAPIPVHVITFVLHSHRISGCLTFPAESLDQFQSPQFYVYVVNASLISAPTSPILARIDNDTSAIRNWEIRCDEGNYCVGGERFPCDAGTYGNERVRGSVASAPCSRPVTHVMPRAHR